MPDDLITGRGPAGPLTAFELQRVGLDMPVVKRRSSAHCRAGDPNRRAWPRPITQAHTSRVSDNHTRRLTERGVESSDLELALNSARDLFSVDVRVGIDDRGADLSVRIPADDLATIQRAVPADAWSL